MLSKESLLSRQVGKIFNENQLKSILELKIFIYGADGVAIEVIKNLALITVKKICVFDQKIMRFSDLGVNFFANQDFVYQKTRFEASLENLKALNSNIEISGVSQEILINEEFLREFDVIIVTEALGKEVYKINEISREIQKKHKKQQGFIYALNLGLFSFVFNDFGESFKLSPKKPKQGHIISLENSKLKYVSDDKFYENELIFITGLNDIEELNNKTFKIKQSFIEENSIDLELTVSDNEINHNNMKFDAKIIHVVPDVILKFKSLNEVLNGQVEEINEAEGDEEDIYEDKVFKKQQMILLIKTFFEFVQKYHCLPKLLNIKDAEEFVSLFKQMYFESFHKELTANEEALAKKMAYYSQTQISPITSFIGSITAQEAIKTIGINNPYHQCFFYETYEMIEVKKEFLEEKVIDSRERDYICLFGKEFSEKFSKENIFIVGAGALGCELLKNITCVGKGNITIIDDDIIESTNIHRQLLFKTKDVGKYKAETAVKTVKSLNPELNISSFNEKLCNSRSVFNDDFWERQDVVFGAVDNYDARKTIDEFCNTYDKIFLDSGTSGLSYNTQVIIPYKTIGFDGEKPKNIQFAGCTLRIPTKIEHTIKWALDLFHKMFVEIPTEIKRILENPKGYLKKVEELYEKKEEEQHLFYDEINHLILLQPENFICDTGRLYWFPPRKFPNPMKVNDSDDFQIRFFGSIVKILAGILNLHFEMIDLYQEIEKELKYYVKSQESLTKKEISIEIEELKSLLENFETILPHYFTIHTFDKDNDNLFHVDFVYYASSLRAKVFKLESIERSEVRIIAGNISPAIITSSSCAASMILLELFKLLITDNINIIKNVYGNLGMGSLSFIKTSPADNKWLNVKDEMLNYQFADEKMTIWDKITMNSQMKLHEIVEILQGKYKKMVGNVFVKSQEGENPIYEVNKKNNKNSQRWEKNLQMTIEEICHDIIEKGSKNMFLELKVFGFDSEKKNITYVFPKIKYYVM